MKRYELSKPLGKVGRSAVFLATDKSTGKQVVIKLFSNVTDSERECLLRDARTLQELEHPNVVRILDAGADEDKNAFYVMEYLADAIPLHHMVPQNQGLSLEKSWPLVESLCSAVAAIHEAGILHLDLKPGNILVTTGTPKIIDFGLLVPHQPGTFRGTPGYVAPELILGQKPTPQSDIYSLGAVLNFIWTGHKLFSGESPEQTLAYQLQESTYATKNPDLTRIIQRATKQNPHKRYGSIGDLFRALVAFHHEQEYRAEEPSEDPTKDKWGHWLIAGTLFTLVCIAFWIYYSLLTSV